MSIQIEKLAKLRPVAPLQSLTTPTTAIVCLALLTTPGAIVAQEKPARLSPEQRALDFLSREVPQWPQQHNCFSCHNNGDAARALYQGTKLGYAVPAAALKTTNDWLAHPGQWRQSVGNAEFKDERLAFVQFATALAAALDAGQLRDRQSLVAAAHLVAAEQHADGAWHLGDEGAIGSPTTYGRTLGTVFATRVLEQADANGYRKQIAAARTWIRSRQPQSVLEAAAVLWAIAQDKVEPAATLRQTCLEILQRGESAEGGWGPYVNSPPEAFDTALVILALKANAATRQTEAFLSRGRAYLIGQQLEDGAWAETTRPRGAESYAQRLSTAGWCTLALLATRPID